MPQLISVSTLSNAPVDCAFSVVVIVQVVTSLAVVHLVVSPSINATCASAYAALILAKSVDSRAFSSWIIKKHISWKKYAKIIKFNFEIYLILQVTGSAEKSNGSSKEYWTVKWDATNSKVVVG